MEPGETLAADFGGETGWAGASVGYGGGEEEGDDEEDVVEGVGGEDVGDCC